MSCCPWRLSASAFVVAVAAVMLSAAIPAVAAPDEQNAAQSTGSQAPPSPDFMLGRPRGSLGVRGNFVFAAGGSDIYDFVTDQLTLEKSNFNAPAVGAELAINIASRTDVMFAVELAKSATGSEYRDFIDGAGLPIQQTTSLRTVNIMVSGKFALTPRGRSISRFAWIPRTVTPYVGAGAGAVNYDFQQDGDFVDYQDNHVFTERFRAQGWAPSAHAFGGADVQLHNRLFLSIEGRYVWSAGDLGEDFIDFDPMDLSGFRFGAGFHVVF